MVTRINNFTVIDSIYGRLIVNRHCEYQAEYLIKTGVPPIHVELEKILTIVRTLPSNCMVVDAGANIGLIAVPIADAIREKGGVVYAFEVQRMIHYALCGTAAMNDLSNLFVFHLGLGAKQSRLRVPKVDYGQPQDFGLVSLVEQEKTGDYEEVDVTTIDALALCGLDLLKVDVEGMEIEVLRGARCTIESFRPWCWVEYWKTGHEMIKKAFDGLNYRFFTIDQLNLLCAPVDRLTQSKLTINASEV